MPLIRPRLTGDYGVAVAKEDVDFAIPFLDGDIPLPGIQNRYVWKAR